MGVIAIDQVKKTEQFEKWYHAVMMANERTAPLSANEMIFLKNRFNEGKNPNDVVI